MNRAGLELSRIRLLRSGVMSELEQLGASEWRAVVEVFAAALAEHREAINQLNVYPVPDGDTGTNMALTLGSVVDEFGEADSSLTLAQVCDAISHGSLMGARGNSGVIMSQILRGLAGELRDVDTIGATQLSQALTVAAKAAYGAVGNPVEGTILTVVREMAEKGAEVTAADASVALVDLVTAVRDEGYASLERTPELLQVLKDAGVVDAGGRGLLLLMDAALKVIDGRAIPVPKVTAANLNNIEERPDEHGSNIADLRYEVMFLLDAPDDCIEGFKDAWAEVGDSIVVVGGDGIWNCHIHCDDIGASIEAGIAVGRPHRIRVTDLLEELEHLEDMAGPSVDPNIAINSTEPTTTGVVSVSVGAGVTDIFASLGVQVVVTGGQTMNPSTQLLLDAVEKVNADQIIILPNNKNIIAVAEQVNGQSDKQIQVVPTKSIAEGFAALMAYDPGSDSDANKSGMSEAAAAIVAGEITQAVRDTDTDVGPVQVGDWLGLAEGKIAAVDADLETLAQTLLNVMINEDAELVTLICGEGASEENTAAIGVWLETNHPDVEIEIHLGGQPLYPYYIGVE